VSASGSARNHYLADVKVVLRCVTPNPVQRATTVLNRCWSERNFRYEIDQHKPASAVDAKTIPNVDGNALLSLP
jgi:hypothetical protein